MANTTEIIRLMRHAADLLRNSDPVGPLAKSMSSLTYSEDRVAAAKALKQTIVAMTYAEALLRMVAAAMDDDTPLELPEVRQVGGASNGDED